MSKFKLGCVVLLCTIIIGVGLYVGYSKIGGKLGFSSKTRTEAFSNNRTYYSVAKEAFNSVQGEPRSVQMKYVYDAVYSAMKERGDFNTHEDIDTLVRKVVDSE